MKLTARDLEIFKLLNRYRFLRRTFIHALLAEPEHAGRLRHRIYELSDAHYLREPERQKQTANYRYTPRVYELGLKGEEALKERGVPIVQWTDKAHEFWHQLMICDIVASIEIACKHKGLEFKSRHEALDKPFHLASAHGQVWPDELFTINGTPFVLEADRATESNAKRWTEKIEKYSDVLRNQTYKDWGFGSLIILCMFTTPIKAENVKNLIPPKKSKSLSFRGVKALGSYDRAPKPMVTILDDLWHRAGHEPHSILTALERR